MTDGWIVPGLVLLVDASIRWGVVLAALAVWFALRPPRRAATRHLLCVSALAAGAALPFTPRWNAAVPWPVASHTAVSSPVPPALPVDAPPTATAPVSSTPATPTPIPSGRGASPRTATIPAPALRAGPASLDWTRVAVLVAAVAWGVVVLGLFARLTCGVLTLARMKREAVEPGADAERLLEACRTQLGTSRPTRLAVHPGVASPLVVGGFHPWILVPTDWNDWPEPRRRACLLHELAHLARYDDWSKFAQELLRVPYFFHPLARWLSARLDRERELLCDEAVVALGADPASLARLLLDLAKRPARLVQVSRRVSLPFLDRRTVVIRIERLLEDDMPRTLSRLSPAWSLAFGSVVLALLLGLGGLRVTGSAPAQKAAARRAARARVPQEGMTTVRTRRVDSSQVETISVLDVDGKPAADAEMVTGYLNPDKYGGGTVFLDGEGRHSDYSGGDDEDEILFIAWKEGAGAGLAVRRKGGPRNLTVRLGQAKPVEGITLDEHGKPIAGATVRLTVIRKASDAGDGKAAVESITVPRFLREHGKAVRLLVATTGADGSFSLPSFHGEIGRKLEVVAADGRVLLVRSQADRESIRPGETFVVDTPLKSPRLTAVPGAKISGRITTKLPDVSVRHHLAFYLSHARSNPAEPPVHPGTTSLSQADGRFVFEGLEAGTVDVLLAGQGGNDDWTCRPVAGVELALGKTTEVEIELIPGVEIEGRIVVQGTGAPVAEAEVAVLDATQLQAAAGAFGVQPDADGRSLLRIFGVKTDDEGRYFVRAHPGEAHLIVKNLPRGYSHEPARNLGRAVAIPDGVEMFEAPPIEVAAAPTVRGRVVDALGEPVAGVKILGVFEKGNPQPFEDASIETDAQGAFRLPPGSFDMVKVGRPSRLHLNVDHAGANEEFEGAAIPADDGSVTVQLPVVQKPPGGVEGPRDVAADEVAALVVDPEGKPIEGAEASLMAIAKVGNQMVVKTARSDARGIVRIGGLDQIAGLGSFARAEVKISKPGAVPQRFMQHPIGQSGWVVVLGTEPCFEGRVTGPDGKPAAGTLVRANSGPKRGGSGYVNPGVWTEARTDDDGRYRMPAQPDIYDVEVRVPNVGQAKIPQLALRPGEARTLDIGLDPGADFRAKVVDSVTGAPAAGVRLWHYQYPDVDTRSDEKGELTISAMTPGPFHFNVDAPGYARQWSEQAAGEHSRRWFDKRFGGWQGNTGYLEFDLQPGMPEARIVVERAVTLSGRVVDPDGKPFAGAMVALNVIYDDPPRTVSLGFSVDGSKVESDPDGKFRMTVPASNDHQYNLVAHDGKRPHEWRTWANGVLPSIRTKPGDVVEGLEIQLQRPATIRGRVFDWQGRGAAGARVHVTAVDRLDNHTYDRSVESGPGGVYELDFLRPGAQLLRLDPFVFNEAGEELQRPSHVETVAPGQVVEGVDFQIPRPESRGVGPQAAR